MPDSLSYSVSILCADDTEIYASSNNCDDLVDKVNFDLQNIHKWMTENKLQTHSNNSKHMFIGSSYYLKNKITMKPILINNQPIPRADSYSCLGVNMEERHSWEKHIDNICSKVGAGIGAMRRIKPYIISQIQIVE